MMLCGLFSSLADDTPQTAEYLQSISVIIKTVSVGGSGVVLTRKDSTGSNDISFVWSVGHLFEDTQTLIIPVVNINIFNLFNSSSNLFSLKTNSVNILKSYATIYQEYSTNGEVTGTNFGLLKLIKFSPSEKDDISLSLIDGQFFNTNSVRFDLSDRIPRIGEKLYNLSYPYGQMTFSEGVFSAIGKNISGYVYDQSSCVCYPGSSGGGYYTIDGLCVGLVDMVNAPSINYMIPIRKIKKWALDNHLEWAIDPSLPIPSTEELEKLTIH